MPGKKSTNRTTFLELSCFYEAGSLTGVEPLEWQGWPAQKAPVIGASLPHQL